MAAHGPRRFLLCQSRLKASQEPVLEDERTSKGKEPKSFPFALFSHATSTCHRHSSPLEEAVFPEGCPKTQNMMLRFLMVVMVQMNMNQTYPRNPSAWWLTVREETSRTTGITTFARDKSQNLFPLSRKDLL